MRAHVRARGTRSAYHGFGTERNAGCVTDFGRRGHGYWTQSTSRILDGYITNIGRGVGHGFWILGRSRILGGGAGFGGAVVRRMKRRSWRRSRAVTLISNRGGMLGSGVIRFCWGSASLFCVVMPALGPKRCAVP